MVAAAEGIADIRQAQIREFLGQGHGDLARSGDLPVPPFRMQVRHPHLVILSHGLLDIVDGDTTPALSDGSDFGSVILDGWTVTRTFVVWNRGTDDLVLGSVELVDNVGFEITQQPGASVLSPDSYTTFTISLLTDQVGSKSATVRLINSDLNEDPFEFDIAGLIY